MTAGFAIAVLCAACGGPFHDDVEVVFAHHHSAKQAVAAPASLVPVAAKVGQWVLYRETKGSNVGYQLAAITSDDAGTWIEYVWGGTDHRTVSKACYERLPDLSSDVASWNDLVQFVVTQSNDAPPLLIDLRTHTSARTKTWLDLEKFHANMDGARWRHDDLPREDIDVGAGRFGQAIRVANHAQTLTMWFHPGVPITAMVRSHASDGTDVELVAYGDAGATTAVADVPGPAAYVACVEQPVVGSSLSRLVCQNHQRTVEDDTQLKNLMGGPVPGGGRGGRMDRGNANMGRGGR